ncbi:MAG: methyltransferase domain-containing protein [Ruminococcus sp.]|nr:methyltransferase domain-containing protein [Ruminococcus sp.]
MSKWNTDLYLKFKQQRTQPALDLAKRIERYNPLSIADLGCGPGNSTAVLKSVFPNARLIGIDNSVNMIEKAKTTYTDIEFKLGDIQNLNEKYDLIFSNACLQWVPNHNVLLPYLIEQLNDNGVLAVQIPINGNEPLFKIIKDTAEQSEFDFSQAYFENNDALPPNEYYEILSMCASSFDIWETVYYHEMSSHEELINWVRSTRLRPYLDCLSESDKKIFEADLLKKVKEQYSVMKNGNVILKFRRLFFVAIK